MFKSVKLHSVLAATTLLVACQSNGVSFANAKLSATGPTPPVRISGLLAKPEGKGPFPAVVLLHTCGGVKPHVSVDWPNYLTGLGHVVLTVDSFGPRGGSLGRNLTKQLKLA
jgi:dienelactone hydrolase